MEKLTLDFDCIQLKTNFDEYDDYYISQISDYLPDLDTDYAVRQNDNIFIMSDGIPIHIISVEKDHIKDFKTVCSWCHSATYILEFLKTAFGIVAYDRDTIPLYFE